LIVQSKKAMNCNICSTTAQTVATWHGTQTEQGKPDIYSVWQCENGHHFYTLSTWQERHYKTNLIDPKDVQFIRHLL
jgi:hypothetical protein